MADRFPLILNTSANQIQEIASGDTLDLSGTNIKGVGIITATNISGNIIAGAGTSNIVAGIVTAVTFKGDGDFVELDVDGHTNLDNVSVVGVVTVAGNVTAHDFLPDTNAFRNIGSSSKKFNQVHANTFIGNGDFVELDVDGHTNLDNLSVAGVSTFAGNADFSSGIDVTGTITGTSHIDLPDAAQIKLGDFDEFIIQHTSGGASLISETGSGNLDISATNIQLKDASGNNKLQTNGGGIAVTGNATVSGNLSVGGVLTYEDVTNVDSVGIVTAREGVFIPDNKTAKFGNTAGSPDLQIFHRSADNASIISEVGAGSLSLESNGNYITFYDSANARTMARFNNNGSCEFKHGATTRLQTSATGVEVTGTLVATTFSGSGASLTSLPAANLTGALPAISGANLTGVLKNIVEDSSPQLGGDLDCNQKGILLQDRNSGNQGAIKWGDNGEMWMFHAGADNTNRIYSSGKEWGIWSGSSNDHIAFKVTASDTDPAVELYYNNDKKFHTRSLGATVSGGLHINTDSAITGTPLNYLYGYNSNATKNGITIEGAESGLELIGSANGDHSSSILLRNLNDGFAFINDNDANQLELKYFTAASDNFHVHGTGGGLTKLKSSAIFKEDGAVELYNNNTKRIETAGHGAKVSGYLTMTAPVGFCAYRRDTGTDDEYPMMDSSNAAINGGYFGQSSLQTPRGQLTTNTQYDNNGVGGSCYSHDGTKFTAPIAGVYTLTFNLSLYVRNDNGGDNSVGWGFLKNQTKINWGTYDSGLSVTQSTPYVIGQDSTSNLTSAFEIGAPHLTIITTLAAGDEIQVGWNNMSKILGVRSFIFSGHLLG